MDDFPPDDAGTPGDTPDAPGGRRGRRRDRSGSRIVGVRTAGDLTAERPRPDLSAPPEPPPPLPEEPADEAEPDDVAGDAAGDVEWAEDQEWADDEAEDDGDWEEDTVTYADAEATDTAAVPAAGPPVGEATVDEWSEDDDVEWEDDEEWEEEPAAEQVDEAPDPSRFGAIPVIRPGDPPPPGIEIPDMPAAPPPPPPVASDDEWAEGAADDELEEGEEWEWEDEEVAEDDGATVMAFPDQADDAPTAAMDAIPPPPPPPPPPPRLEEVPPVSVGEDEYADDLDADADEQWDDDDDELVDLGAELDEDELEPPPPGLRLAAEPPSDEPPLDGPAVGEVHDDVSGPDDDLLGTPRGWDDEEDDGLDALIPRRTGQHDAVPGPGATSDEAADAGEYEEYDEYEEDEAEELPHWTEPGTGEVPAAVGGAGDDLDAWSALSSGPRWRDQSAEEWEADSFDDLAHDDTRVGAIGEDDDDEPAVVFDDVAHPEAPLPPGAEPAAHHDPFPADPRRGGILPGGAGDRDPGTDARNLPVAVGVGVGLAVLFLVLLSIRPGAAMLLIIPALVLAVAELFTALRKVGYQPITLLGLVSVAGLGLATFWRGEGAMPLVLFLTVVAGLLWYLAVPGERVAPNLGVTLLGVLWIGLLGSFAPLMLKFPNGGGMLIGAIAVTVAHDVVGLFVGSRMGRSPLTQASPGKTMEGTIGGVVAAVVTGAFVGATITPWSIGTGIQLGAAAAIMAPLGDLAESVLKRDLGVKDMGTLLPGHGGLLDRFDALLFVLPTAYYVVRLNDLF